MLLIWICRYACLVFCIDTLAASCISVVPGHETSLVIFQAVILTFAVTSGIAAVALRRRLASHPESKIFKSKLALGAALIVAAFGTMVLAG